MNESGLSSYCYLQNIFASSQPINQGLSLALYTAKSILGNTGACRVHGGGFAGTVQAFVPYDILDQFVAGIDGALGKGACHVLSIRPQGGVEAFTV